MFPSKNNIYGQERIIILAKIWIKSTLNSLQNKLLPFKLNSGTELFHTLPYCTVQYQTVLYCTIFYLPTICPNAFILYKDQTYIVCRLHQLQESSIDALSKPLTKPRLCINGQKGNYVIHTKFKVMLLSTPNCTLYSSKRLPSVFMYCSWTLSTKVWLGSVVFSTSIGRPTTKYNSFNDTIKTKSKKHSFNYFI